MGSNSDTVLRLKGRRAFEHHVRRFNCRGWLHLTQQNLMLPCSRGSFAREAPRHVPTRLSTSCAPSRLKELASSRRRRLPPSRTASMQPPAHLGPFLASGPVRSARRLLAHLHLPARRGDGAFDVARGDGVGVPPDLPENGRDDAVVLADFNQPARDREVASVLSVVARAQCFDRRRRTCPHPFDATAQRLQLRGDDVPIHAGTVGAWCPGSCARAASDRH